MYKKDGAYTLFWGGIFFTVVVLLWPILMAVSELQGQVAEQLQQIGQEPGLYMANFFVASLIAPAILVLMITFAFAVDTGRRVPVFDYVGAVFLAAYAVLVSVSYTSQYAYLPRLLAAGEMETAMLWYFGCRLSVPYFLNQLGYASFGIAALLIAYKLLYERGIPRVIGILLWISALLSLAAFAGLAFQIEAQGVLSIISGLLTLPMGVLSINWGKKGLPHLHDT